MAQRQRRRAAYPVRRHPHARGTGRAGHVADPVVFKKSLRAEIEHKGSQAFPDGKVSGFIERDDLMSSVALWYQTEPHKPWPALPAGPDRLPFHDTVLAAGWKSLAQAKRSEHPLTEQAISGATDGRAVGTFDLFNASSAMTDDSLGRQTLTAGNHVLRFECAGHNAASKNYSLGFDSLLVRIPVYVLRRARTCATSIPSRNGTAKDDSFSRRHLPKGASIRGCVREIICCISETECY